MVMVWFQTIDPKFDDLEQKVLSLESLTRTLLKDVASGQEEQQVKHFQSE